MDYVGRAYGVLMNAQLLTSREMLDLLSALRLGVDVGIVRDISRVRNPRADALDATGPYADNTQPRIEPGGEGPDAGADGQG